MFFSDDLEDLFETHRPYGRSETGFLAGRSFRPAADVYESPEGLVISLDVPGLERDQVALKLEGRRMTVSGSREFQREHPDEEFVRLERGFGSFRRVFEIPSDVDADGISAKLDNGVLTITVPRRTEHRTIPVESDEGAE
jgi:HSP20 family protein